MIVRAFMKEKKNSTREEISTKVKKMNYKMISKK